MEREGSCGSSSITVIAISFIMTVLIITLKQEKYGRNQHEDGQHTIVWLKIHTKHNTVVPRKHVVKIFYQF